MDVKILTNGVIPSELCDDIIKEHLIVEEMTSIIYTYRDAAIDYVERYTNVPIREKTVQQQYKDTTEAECMPDTDTYTFSLKYRTDDDEAITEAVYGDDDTEIPLEDITLDNWKTINQITIKNLPHDAKNIRITYDVQCSNTPPGLISAVLILLAEMYETRSVVESRRILNIRQVMQPYRIYM